ncbi:hypothetical protein [Halotia branconii]|uniref:PEP-CTERM sorting domain-containing protein n=1 Tax=Halotia branconii CENA392 TaxID=1539056 RepID=A0AAJ6NYH5_9CYAN|nr:hypothetical protein [Halotia branconii]WGV28987.1 hypothetical protein QI031_30980 [Halotia branconii CENA392]
MKLFQISVLVSVATVTSILATTSPSQALSKTFNLNLVLQSGTGSATGTATFDDSLLTPNQYIASTSSTAGLDGFQINFTGLLSTPSATTFTLSDLTGWILTTNSSSQITDLNFFMNSPKTNANGLSIQGVSPFTLNVYQGNSSGSAIAQFGINPTEAVPFDIPGGATIPAVGGLLALGLMRKARKSIASSTRVSHPISEMVS